jgi:hypothetical protein
MESIRAGTKWFKKSRANLVKRYLEEKGIKTRIVKTTKINPLSGAKKPAYLVKRI